MSSIFFGQTQEPLFHGDGWDGVDTDASHARFCERLQERLEAAFPGVDVEVGTETDRRWADGFGEAMNESVAADCVIISEQLYQEPDEWVVMVPRDEQILVPDSAARDALRLLASRGYSLDDIRRGLEQIELGATKG
jgi:hypothetical protein